MKMRTKVFSILLAVVMLVCMIPDTVLAVTGESVYVSVSYDGKFVEDKNNAPIAYVEVPMSMLEAIDLAAYGLSDYLYDADGDGDYEITALHLYVYTQENIIGNDWDSVRVSGGPGSIFFEEGLFGFEDCNLNYYLNGEYPAVDGWGLTADQLTLSAGDFYDIAGYSGWNFYADSANGFHYFADDNGEITHSYNAKTNSELKVKLVRSGGLFSEGNGFAEVGGYELFYGTSLGNPGGTIVTDESGCADITFDTAGTWYLWCEGSYGAEYWDEIVSSPAYAKVTVAAEETDTPARQPQSVSNVLNATMTQLASTVTAPAFGTNAGEWTVLSLARGEYYNTENIYFADYYNRIVGTVNEKAASVNLKGALHKSKSTDNSRLIVALSSIGKDATCVGEWNLISPYDDFSWIKKQGLNGVIWALIALDTNDYQTVDTTIRKQCIDFLLEKQFEDGGWALSGTTADPDVTSMALQALYQYRDQNQVAVAAEEAFACLSDIQNADGGYSSFGDPNSESCSQVIVACTTWGINPDTDMRFVKNDRSVVDALLTHYVDEEAAFKHVAGGTINGMATDQACYALVAYNRFLNQKNSLYDMADVVFEDISAPKELAAILGLPAQVENEIGTTFNAVISLNGWDNAADYKLMDFILTIPDGLRVVDVAVGNRMNGGAVSYYLEEETGKLRVVYFDANENKSLTISGTAFPAEIFNIVFEIEEELLEEEFNIAITGMSVKRNSDAYDEASMVVVNTDAAAGIIEVVDGMTFSAVCLYQGDNVDLISTSKKAVAVAVTAIEEQPQITYDDGTNVIEFLYSKEFSRKTGVACYVALVDASMDMENFAKKGNYTVEEESAENITFGDINGDGVINAQDALSTVDAWLRKTAAPTEQKILAMNVNGDSRINTFDALGIVEAFVNNSEYAVVTKTAILSTKQ